MWYLQAELSQKLFTKKITQERADIRACVDCRFCVRDKDFFTFHRCTANPIIQTDYLNGQKTTKQWSCKHERDPRVEDHTRCGAAGRFWEKRPDIKVYQTEEEINLAIKQENQKKSWFQRLLDLF